MAFPPEMMSRLNQPDCLMDDAVRVLTNERIESPLPV